MHTASNTASSSPTASHPVTRDTDWLRAGELEAHDRDPRLARFVYQTAGLQLENTVVQTWQVGEHQLQVVVWPDESLRYVLRINSGWPAAIKRHRSQQPPTGLALAEVYVITIANHLHLPRGPELGRGREGHWSTPGSSSRTPSNSPNCRPKHPQAPARPGRRLRPLQIRFLVDPADEPVPLSSPFLSLWSGLPQSTLERGKQWLEPRGFITRAGHAPFGWPAPCLLWNVTQTTIKAHSETGNTSPLPTEARDGLVRAWLQILRQRHPGLTWIPPTDAPRADEPRYDRLTYQSHRTHRGDKKPPGTDAKEWKVMMAEQPPPTAGSDRSDTEHRSTRVATATRDALCAAA